MKIELRDAPVNAWHELGLYQNTQTSLLGKFGAANVFIGSMRDFNDDKEVKSLFLEHYPEMTQHYMEKIANEAMQRWNILDVFMLHRYGELNPGDTIVVLAIWSAHRDEAFQACRYLIEELKHRAPFWKKETLNHTDKSRWVNQPERS
jgi:molybdopterin synthase catalytic subunit